MKRPRRDTSLNISQLEDTLDGSQPLKTALHTLSEVIFADDEADDDSLQVIKALVPKCINQLLHSDDMEVAETVIGLMSSILNGETAITAGVLFDHGDMLTVVPYLTQLIPLLCQPEIVPSHHAAVDVIVHLVLMMQAREIRAVRHVVEDLVDVLNDLHVIRCVSALHNNQNSNDEGETPTTKEILLVCFCRVYQHFDCLRNQAATTRKCQYPCCRGASYWSGSSDCKHSRTVMTLDLSANTVGRAQCLQVLLVTMLGKLVDGFDMFMFEAHCIVFDVVLNIMTQRSPPQLSSHADAATYIASTTLRCVCVDAMAIFLRCLERELPVFILNKCVDVALMLLDSRSSLGQNSPKFYRSDVFDKSLATFLRALFLVLPVEVMGHVRLDEMVRLVVSNLRERRGIELKRCLCWIMEVKLMRSYPMVLLRVNSFVCLLEKCTEWWEGDDVSFMALIGSLRVCLSSQWLPQFCRELDTLFQSKHIGDEVVGQPHAHNGAAESSEEHHAQSPAVDQQICQIVWPAIKTLIECALHDPSLVSSTDSSVSRMDHFLVVEVTMRLFLPFLTHVYARRLLNVLIDRLCAWISALEAVTNESDMNLVTPLWSTVAERLVVLVEDSLQVLPETLLTRVTMGMIRIVSTPWLLGDQPRDSRVTEMFPQSFRETCLRFVGVLPTLCSDREKAMLSAALEVSSVSCKRIALVVLPLMTIRLHTGIFRRQSVLLFMDVLAQALTRRDDSSIREVVAWMVGFMVCIYGQDDDATRRDLVRFAHNVTTRHVMQHQSYEFSQLLPLPTGFSSTMNGSNHSPTTISSSSMDGMSSRPGARTVHLQCSVCENRLYKKSGLQLDESHADVLRVFLQLMSHEESAEVRTFMARSIFRIINHMNEKLMDQFDLACSIVELILDKDMVVRNAASHNLEKLVGRNDVSCPFVVLFEGYSYEQRDTDSATTVDTVEFLLSVTNQPHTKVDAAEFNISDAARILRTVDHFWGALRARMRWLQQAGKYNDDLKESALIALASIGTRVTGEAQAYILWHLTVSLMHANLSVRAVCCEQLKRISEATQVKLASLVKMHAKHLLPAVFRRALVSPYIINEVCATLLDMSIDEFLEYSRPFVLPYFVMARNRKVIELFAHLSKKRLFDVMFESAATYLPPIFIFMSEHIETQVFTFLKDILLRTDLSRLALQYRQDICNELLERMGEENMTVVKSAERALSLVVHLTNGTLSVADGEQEGGGADDQVNVAKFLAREAYNVFFRMNQVLVQNPRSTCNEKLNALRSLGVFIRLANVELRPYIPRVMSTLKGCMQDSAVRALACETWYTFVRHIGVTSLGPSLAQIIVTLLDYIDDDSCNTTIAQILSFLLVDSRDELRSYVNEIPTLPRVPLLTGVIASVEGVMGKMTFTQKLQHHIQVISHNSANVRAQGLSQLRTILQQPENQRELYNSSLEGEMGVVLSALVRCLLQRCADSSMEVRQECSKAIGELGAIDPGLLQVTVHNHVIEEETDNDTHARKLIENFIVPCHRAADNKQQNRALYALQELLKFIGCDGNTAQLYEEHGADGVNSDQVPNPQRRGLKNWSLFANDDFRAMIEPSLRSQYTFTNPKGLNRRLNSEGRPVFFKSRECRTHVDWLACWTRYLTSFLNETPRAKMFGACLGVVRQDANIAQALLPYIVMDVLRYGTDKLLAEVKDEIMAVVQLDNRTTTKDDQICMQVVFDLTDILKQWCLLARKRGIHRRKSGGSSSNRSVASRAPSSVVSGGDGTSRARTLDEIVGFLRSIPKLRLANAAYQCNAYTRALKYLELHLRDRHKTWMSRQSQDKVDVYVYRRNLAGGWDANDVEFLQLIYSQVDEPDGMKGIARVRHVTSIDQQARDYESEGMWNEALTCNEQCLSMHHDRLEYQERLLNCLKNLGHWQNCITHVQGALGMMNMHHGGNRHSNDIIRAYGVQAAWRLGRWDLLSDTLQVNTVTHDTSLNFELDLGRLLLSIQRDDDRSFHETLTNSRNRIMRSLSASSRESYRRSYQYFVQLHMLTELEQFRHHVTLQAHDSHSPLSFWHLRFDRTESSFHWREPILSLRRILYEKCGMQKRLAESWLQLAEEARNSRRFDVSEGALLSASHANTLTVGIERCKLLRAKGAQHEAMIELERHVQMQEMRKTEVDLEANRTLAESEVLLGEWYQEYGARDNITVQEVLNNALQCQSEWDKAHYVMAKFYDASYSDTTDDQPSKRRSADFPPRRSSSAIPVLPMNALHSTLEHYCEALKHGSTFLFQALPRLLTLWFEYGENHEHHAPINSLMFEAVDSIATFQWLSALPQIISRICHPNKDIWEFIRLIIERVFHDYPDQSLWGLASLLKSTRQSRKARADIILGELLEGAAPSMAQKIAQVQGFFEQLIGVCRFVVKRNKKDLKVSSKFPLLRKMLPVDVVVPVLSSLSVIVPPLVGKSTNSNGHVDMSGFFAFPEQQITVEDILDRIVVLKSKETPRKLTIRGSDGHSYHFLCKMEKRGDMRKNSRMMEFCTVINRLFRHDDASRLRKLQLRTFSVLPLTEECGLIEWVKNTVTFRNLLQECHMKTGDHKSVLEIKDLYEHYGNALEARLRLYRRLLEEIPPAYHLWALNQFPEPTEWFENRLIYTRSAAVWSMVGYIVGLGDRHCENILIDTTNGECVHVDFDCLFDKAQMLKEPEKVFFRLTPNVIDGFGITGYEGVYRRSCEVIMTVLRENRDLLLNVLQTFVHDPLVEWRNGSADSASHVLSMVLRRLSGKWKNSLPLSVKGHVHELIKDATSERNLCRMYIGWMSWL